MWWGYATLKAFASRELPPSTVATLIFQRPMVAAYGMVTLPTICVGAILNIAGFSTFTEPVAPVVWLRNFTVVPTGLEVVPGQGEGDRRVPIPGCWRDAADHGRVFFKKKAAVAENLREIFRVVLCILNALHKQNRAIRL